MNIKQVARLARVSPATVSRVLNDNATVDPVLRDKVLAVIKTHHYRPSRAARNLKTGRTNTIGLVVSDLSDWYYSNLTKAVGDCLRENNYSLFICSTDDDPGKEREYLDLLVDKQVDGILLNTAGQNDEFICGLSRRTPLVLVNRRVEGDSLACDFIDSGNMESAEMMAAHLINHGHRRIGIINGNPRVSTARERLRGFAGAMRRIGIAVGPDYPYVYQDRYTVETGFAGAEMLLNCSPAPTALMTMNDSITVGALRYCKANSIRLPESLSLVAYGEVGNAELFAVQPDYITFDPRIAGSKAVGCILDRIAHPRRPNREIICSSILVAKGSVAAPLQKSVSRKGKKAGRSRP